MSDVLSKTLRVHGLYGSSGKREHLTDQFILLTPCATRLPFQVGNAGCEPSRSQKVRLFSSGRAKKIDSSNIPGPHVQLDEQSNPSTRWCLQMVAQRPTMGRVQQEQLAQTVAQKDRVWCSADPVSKPFFFENYPPNPEYFVFRSDRIFGAPATLSILLAL